MDALHSGFKADSKAGHKTCCRVIVRTWLDANPDDELTPEMRADLDREPLRYTMFQRPLLGWGIFALMKR